MNDLVTFLVGCSSSNFGLVTGYLYNIWCVESSEPIVFVIIMCFEVITCRYCSRLPTPRHVPKCRVFSLPRDFTSLGKVNLSGGMVFPEINMLGRATGREKPPP